MIAKSKLAYSNIRQMAQKKLGFLQDNGTIFGRWQLVDEQHTSWWLDLGMQVH